MYISESETLCRTRYLSITTFMITRQWLLVNQLSVQPGGWWVGTHKVLDSESVLAISQIITCGYTQKVSQLSLTHVRSQCLGLKTSGSKINMSLQMWPISFLLCPYPLYITGLKLQMVIYYKMHRYLAILLRSKYIYNKIKLILSYN